MTCYKFEAGRPRSHKHSRAIRRAKKRSCSKYLTIAGVLTVVLGATPLRADIIYPDFSSISGLTLNESAAQVGNVLRLTPAAGSLGGSAWYNIQPAVQNGFRTIFQFQITTVPGIPNADGFAFVVQNSLSGTSAIGTHGGSIGYSGIDNSLAVEFDTFQNNPFDPNANHIAVVSCGTAAITGNHDAGCTLGINPSLPFTLADGSVHTATVDYVPGTLTASLDGTLVVTALVDLSTELSLNSGNAWVGFTAATGSGIESHDILNWSFTSIPEPATVLLLSSGLASMVFGKRRCGKMKMKAW